MHKRTQVRPLQGPNVITTAGKESFKGLKSRVFSDIFHCKIYGQVDICNVIWCALRISAYRRIGGRRENNGRGTVHTAESSVDQSSATLGVAATFQVNVSGARPSRYGVEGGVEGVIPVSGAIEVLFVLEARKRALS